jgi:cyclopropane-fatty-acyl-phospholipid synthase
MWDLYLAYCEAGFRERRISDVQLLLAKPAYCAERVAPLAEPITLDASPLGADLIPEAVGLALGD